ncbi:MAG: ABC transporter ATP-binding protein [Planctomycetota bacterium]|nr:ABC transporter ATP-binding protein [Planctomycetota bacterium]
MSEFLRFFRQNLKEPGLLVWALFFAFLSATSLGVGLVGMIPVVKLIVDEQDKNRGLVDWAERYNEADHDFDVPQWIISRLPTDRFDGVILIISGLAILTLFGAICNFMHQYFSITLAAKTSASIRQRVYEHVLRLPVTLVSYQGPSQFIARIIRDAADIQRGIVSLTGKAVANVTKGFVAFGVALFAGGSLTMAALVVVPIVAFILRKLGKRIRRGTKGALHGQEELLRLSTETLHGLRAVKANTGERISFERFSVKNDEVVHQYLKARLARALSTPLLEIIAFVAVGGLVIFAAKSIIDGSLSMDRFMLALGSLAVAGSSLKPLARIVNEIQAASAPAERLAEVLSYELEEVGEAKPDMPRHTKTIVFEGIGLTYPGKDDPALDDVSLKIEHGQRIAIVGPNGSGKTTLLSMIPRLLIPDSGRVLIDGEDVMGFNLHSIRTQVGVVTQETILFRGSIEENIAYGLTDVTHDQIIEASKHARCHGFIENIPGGYKANLLELGASLSGGQRQRLAIARALLRNPSILILDEATSQIDAESEAQISDAINEFSKDRTVLLIAHRLATVISADRIVVMDEGKIVDQGKHDELLKRCELYRRLNQTQMLASA